MYHHTSRKRGSGPHMIAATVIYYMSHWASQKHYYWNTCQMSISLPFSSIYRTKATISNNILNSISSLNNYIFFLLIWNKSRLSSCQYITNLHTKSEVPSSTGIYTWVPNIHKKRSWCWQTHKTCLDVSHGHQIWYLWKC